MESRHGLWIPFYPDTRNLLSFPLITDLGGLTPNWSARWPLFSTTFWGSTGTVAEEIH